MADFEACEKLFGTWAQWRSGPLKECSPVAREILFTVLSEMAESPRRGYLLSNTGRVLTIAEVRSAFDPYQTIGEWGAGGGDFANWPAGVTELERLGFLAQTAEGVWFCPQMLAGEI